LIKISKDSDFSLVSNKNLNEILPSSGLGLGPDEVGLKQLHLRRHSKKPKTIFFSLQMQRLVESFEGLNSSLTQLSAEIFPCKYTCKLLHFSLSLPEWKVWNLVVVGKAKNTYGMLLDIWSFCFHQVFDQDRK